MTQHNNLFVPVFSVQENGVVMMREKLIQTCVFVGFLARGIPEVLFVGFLARGIPEVPMINFLSHVYYSQMKNEGFRTRILKFTELLHIMINDKLRVISATHKIGCT